MGDSSKPYPNGMELWDTYSDQHRNKRSVTFEMSFWCHQSDQKPNEIFERIFALATKKRSNQKSSERESK